MYDYGSLLTNYQAYKQFFPPKYTFTKLPKTIVTFFGTGDALVTYQVISICLYIVYNFVVYFLSCE